MEDLKQAIVTAPCLHPIDYHSDLCVILAVDSSCIATGFILLQLGTDNKRYPSWFSSITWNALKQRLRFTVFGMPSKLTNFTLLASKIFGWKSMRATSRGCSTILISNQVLWLTGGSSGSSSSNSSWSMCQGAFTQDRMVYHIGHLLQTTRWKRMMRMTGSTKL